MRWSEIPLGLADGGSVAVDVSALADGEHTLRLKAADSAGNERIEEQTVRVDRTKPEAAGVTVTPDGWTDEGEVLLRWTGATDETSGLAGMAYRLAAGGWTAIPLSSAGGDPTGEEPAGKEPAGDGTTPPSSPAYTGAVVVDVSALADGEHALCFKLIRTRRATSKPGQTPSGQVLCTN